MQYLTFLPLVAPLLLLCCSVLLLMMSKNAQKSIISVLSSVGILGIIVGAVSAVHVFRNGTLHQDLLVWNNLGLAFRLDPLSISMFIMITLLGFIVLRFSQNYLDGDARKNVFLARLAATIASVELLVLSGNLVQLFLFWMVTSFCLHYLLNFYSDRPQAFVAARKKFIVARVSDISLFIAFALIYIEFGTAQLEQIIQLQKASGNLSPMLIASTILLALAAFLKSAQFPTQGWLLEVVETPTPVSALLHAGLLNAGPFMIVRMSFLMHASTSANLLLILVGGFTALYASVVFLTQPSIKVALGYSSIAHMGFMFLICGFGVYAAAMLHLIAHSFYKAHAFLSSGSAVDMVRSQYIAQPKRKGNVMLVFSSIAVATLIYALFCYLWGVNPQEDFALMATGAIIVMGLSQIMVPTFDSEGSVKAVLISSAMAFVVALSFFSLEHLAHHILHSQIPDYGNPNFFIKLAVVMVVLTFGAAVFIQLLAPKWTSSPEVYSWGVHLRNGFYANAYFDQLIGALKNKQLDHSSLESPRKEMMSSITVMKPVVSK